jgi:xylulokinase
MSDPLHVVAYDVGTTGAKACLYRLRAPSGPDGRGGCVELMESAVAEYPLRLLPNGGAEQDPQEWWSALCRATRLIMDRSGVGRDAVRALSFCCQMQGLVLVDCSGTPVRPAMTYMDQRATEQKRRGIERGLRFAGMNAVKLIPSLLISGGVSASAKDPVWKYHWVRENEPAVFARVHKWLDGKEYLVHRCTGRFAMTPDSANATFLYDTRPHRAGWSPTLCRLFDVDPAHMPEVIAPSEAAGPLKDSAAADLGLPAGIPVIAGGGDLSLVGLGSGAVGLHETHIYMGTSGWVSAVTDRRVVDTDCYIASILGARPGFYNYISEQETAGKCLEWVRDHLALDEIGIYMSKRTVTEDRAGRYESLFDFLNQSIEEIPAGAGGVLFAPWLRGNRSPFEDPNARGMFFNIGLETGKRCMIRAVVEGIALNSRWQLEAIRRKVPARGPIRFVGGGARSPATARILASVLGETVHTIRFPQNVGAQGAAILCAAGLGVIGSLRDASGLVPAVGSWEPDRDTRDVYDRHFGVLKRLYAKNRESFRQLNQARAPARGG